jgi:hypothetical protein
MSQLAVPRRGWENEHFATFLLSRIAFMAHPLTIGDDVGSDFFCTLFEARDDSGTEKLFPTSSFAIQIKSKANKIPATNKVEYLSILELPFFVGVVDRSNLRLDVYSGEFIPIMFSQYKEPSALTLVPVETLGSSGYCEQTAKRKTTLRLPLVCEISATDPPDALREKAGSLGKLCSLMHSNISARVSREYIFRLNEGDRTMLRLLAGSGSVTTFRDNFGLRLAEVFYNLEWLLKNRPDKFSVQEFAVYDALFKQLKEIGQTLRPLLVDVHGRISQLVNASSR